MKIILCVIVAWNTLIYCLLNVRFKIILLLKYKCFSFLFSPSLSSVVTLKNIPFSNKILKRLLALKIFYFAFYFVMSFLNRKFVPIKRTFKKHFCVFYALVISLLGRLKQNNCFIALFLG